MYLSSYEYEEFEKPRKIVSLDKLKIEGRIVFRIIVDIPVFGQDYGLGGVEKDLKSGRLSDVDSGIAQRTLKDLQNALSG